MSKFYEIRQGGILGELNYLEQLQKAKKRLDREVHQEYQLNTNSNKHEVFFKNQFSSHPERFGSEDSNSSILQNSPCNSPRRCLSSKEYKDPTEIQDSHYNEMNMSESRKKLYENLTCTKERDMFHLEIAAGDSPNVTPMNTIRQREKPRMAIQKKSVFTISNPPPKNVSEKFLMCESVFEKKFKMFSEKSLHTINDIRSLLDKGIEPPDGDEDVSRRQLRVKEFSNRFSRNYLYPLVRQVACKNCQMTDPGGKTYLFTSDRNSFPQLFWHMNRIFPLFINSLMPSHCAVVNCTKTVAEDEEIRMVHYDSKIEDLNKWKPSNQNTNQKLLSSYQIILNGLQAYQNHLPTSIGGCSSDKLKQLLEHLLELCDIHNKMINRESDDNGYVDFLCTIKLHAELTLQKIEDHFTAVSTDSMLNSTTTKLSLQQFRTDPKNNKSKLKKNNIEDRLSMYSANSSFRKDALWKKTAEALAKKKLNVKSRYKTSTYKHRPPTDKPGTQILTLPSKCRLFARKSSTILRKTPLTTPVNEDNIPTMVQMEDTNDDNVGEKTDENKVELVSHEEIVMKLLRLVLDSNRDGESGNADSGKKVSEFLEQLRRKGDVETLQKVLETLQERRQSQEKLELRVLESSERIEDGILKKRKEPTVTVTGAKNAKLICIKDDNSDLEAEDDSEDGKDCLTEKCIPLRSVSTSHTQTECDTRFDKSTQRPTTAVSMKRLKKTSKYLQMLPKEFAVSIVQYKIDFHKHCKGNPMYRRTTNILPWELMARISDEILDFALLGVAREIEVNDIVTNIYQSELQL